MRHFVITGGTGGLGRELSAQVVARGDAAVIVARDPVAGEALVRSLRALGRGAVALVLGDLGSHAGVRALAGALAELPRIDALIHCAGVWPRRRELTVDGVELAFQVNHLAPFLLNALLEPRLVGDRARVIQISSGLYPFGRIDLARTPVGDGFSALRVFATTRLCNLLTTRLWAARWVDRAAIDAIEPGAHSGLRPQTGAVGWLLRQLQRQWPPPGEAARAVLRLVDDRGHGRFFDVLHEVGHALVASDEALARALWADAAARCGVDLPAPPALSWASRGAAGPVGAFLGR